MADKTDRLLNYFRYIRPVERYIGVVAIIVQYVREGQEFSALYYLKKRPPEAVRSHPLSVVPINPGEVFGFLVFGGYIKASSPRRPALGYRRRPFLLVSSCLPACAADFRISRDCRCDSGTDERTDKSRDFFFVGVTLERRRSSLSEK